MGAWLSFPKTCWIKVHDLENRPLLKIWLSGVIWRAEGNCCSVQICSRVDVTWLCIFRGTTGCNFVNDPEHGDSPESARTVQQSKLGQHCNTDDQRQNNSRMDKVYLGFYFGFCLRKDLLTNTRRLHKYCGFISYIAGWRYCSFAMHCVWCRGDTFTLIRAPRSYFLRVIMFSPVNKRLRRRELKTCLQREPWGDMELSTCNFSWKKIAQHMCSIYVDFKEDTNLKQLGTLCFFEKPVTFIHTQKEWDSFLSTHDHD